MREMRGGQERWLRKAHRVRQEVDTLALFPVRKSRGSQGEHQHPQAWVFGRGRYTDINSGEWEANPRSAVCTVPAEEIFKE